MNLPQATQYRIEMAKEEIRCCNQLNHLYSLHLTEPDITELVEMREEALRNSGRVEFGEGVLPKLIRNFCNSPYVDQNNYVSVLADLQDAFYYFKNEANDRFNDDDLIEFMLRVFNGKAEGSTELLTAISLEDLCRWARNDYNDRYSEEEDFD